MIRRFITVAASLALMLSCLTPVQLFAADTDSQSKFSERQINEKSYIFANGNDVVIAQDSDGKTYAALKGDTNDRKEVDENTYLFAGSENDNASYEAVTIEMESGVIGTIVGSNKGTGSITTSNIVINGVWQSVTRAQVRRRLHPVEELHRMQIEKLIQSIR